eukprot:TRINITY_DN6902_c0_g1_i1.p1 TRINITY_DN6902_c0_g1~~TRINITY_DN6902_c0_g1_i1.p1  ORF type:complete len:376 (+),score=92.70 TRINITY_DN6902_c0_g1_i1:54-1181(+)
MQCVNVKEPRHQLAEVASLLEQLGADSVFEDYKGHLETEDYDKVLMTFADLQNLLWENNVSQDDISTFYIVIGSLLLTLQRKSVSETVLAPVISCLTSDKEKNTELRLKLLTDLYNIFAKEDSFKSMLYIQTLEYASQTGQFQVLVNEIQNFDNLINEWKLNKLESRKLMDIAFQVADNQNNYDLVIHYGTICLASFDENEIQDQKDEIAKYLTKILKIEKITTLGRIKELKSVKALETADPQLSGLLNSLFNYPNFTSFTQTNSDYLTANNFDVDVLSVKSRLFTLVDFCSSREQVNYSEISSIIEVSEEEVERWIIRATLKGLMECQLDQLNGVVTIRRAIPVAFEKENWEFLLQRTQAWKQNFEALYKTLNE